MTAEQIDARPGLASALVTAVDHVGIAVPDLDAAIQWYHEHLGMILVHEEINEDQGIREAMLAVRGGSASTFASNYCRFHRAVSLAIIVWKKQRS